MATDRTPLILPRLVRQVSRDVSSGNGQGAIKRTSNTKYIAPFTIVVALERFTYYSLIVNLLIFFNDNVYENKTNKNGLYAGFADINAIVSVMVLVGLSWLFCVLGGWISDAKLGKLKTIIWGLVMYALGTGLLVLSAFFLKHHIIQKRLYRALIVFGSILIALIGEGAYKANIAAFGAEQLDHKDPVSTRRYFNFYYFSLNIGSLFALSVSAYIQQWKGFDIGFGIPFGSITLALIIFVLSRKRYKTLPCQRIVGKVYQIIKEARRNSKRNDQR
jgi:peptide/histidine transporter 3/4